MYMKQRSYKERGYLAPLFHPLPLPILLSFLTSSIFHVFNISIREGHLEEGCPDSMMGKSELPEFNPP